MSDENIKVFYNGHTRINDFEVNEKIYEIRGFKYDNDKQMREEKKAAFEKAGYKIKFIYARTIEVLIKYLEKKKNIDVKQILEEIKKGHESKKYYCFNANF